MGRIWNKIKRGFKKVVNFGKKIVGAYDKHKDTIHKVAGMVPGKAGEVARNGLGYVDKGRDMIKQHTGH
jgi:hypothetical protein